jgi:hypothetical protein
VLPTKFKKVELALLPNDATIRAASDQHGQFQAWQVLASPAANIGHGSYVLKAISLHYLKTFFGVDDTFLRAASSGQRLPAVDWNATNDRATV